MLGHKYVYKYDTVTEKQVKLQLQISTQHFQLALLLHQAVICF